MPELDSFDMTPAGALVLIDADKRDVYIERLLAVDKNIRGVLTSEQTAAYIRALCKQYQLPLSEGQGVSLTILQVVLGLIKEEEWPAALSRQLKMEEAKATKIIKEIKTDLLDLFRGDLEIFWTSGGSGKNDQEAPKEDEKGIGNVVDLRKKSGASPPKPPEIPKG